jgi:hypothetical protein
MIFYKTLGLLFIVFLFAGKALGKPESLKDLKEEFLQGKIKRDDYLDRLVALTCSNVWSNEYKNESLSDTEMSAIDKEIKKYPLSSKSGSEVLAHLRVGEWESPRHGYLYRSNHSWTMLPIEDGVTHGLWKIEGNKYYDWIPDLKETPQQNAYIIILLDAKYFVFSDNGYLYYEKRIR